MYVYMDKMKYNFINNPGAFYTFVNCKRKSTSFPSFMKFVDKESCRYITYIYIYIYIGIDIT